MISEWWWSGKDLVGSGHGLILRYYPSIRLKGLKKTTQNLNQASQSLGLRIETGTSWIWSSSVNHSTTTFGCPDGDVNGCLCWLSNTNQVYSTANIMTILMLIVKMKFDLPGLMDRYICTLMMLYQLYMLCNIKRWKALKNTKWRNMEVTEVYLKILPQHLCQSTKKNHNLFPVPKIITFLAAITWQEWKTTMLR
jgi:hypothetical protein